MNAPSSARADVLARILSVKVEEVAAARARMPEAALRRQAEQSCAMTDATLLPRGFASALRARVSARQPAVIAEIKKASPSKGVLRADFDPEAIARSYAAADATCLSVLTDECFFQGSLDVLSRVRRACGLPLLRKDFIVDSYQVWQARVAGADAILLIVAALADAQMHALEAAAMSVGLDVVVEVHDDAELDRALALSTPLIGINNRDLRTFAVSLDTTIGLLPRIPSDRIVVTESGILTGDDVARMRALGVHAFLVGEAFMRAPDPGTALRAMFGA